MSQQLKNISTGKGGCSKRPQRTERIWNSTKAAVAEIYFFMSCFLTQVHFIDFLDGQLQALLIIEFWADISIEEK